MRAGLCSTRGRLAEGSGVHFVVMHMDDTPGLGHRQRRQVSRWRAVHSPALCAQVCYTMAFWARGSGAQGAQPGLVSNSVAMYK